jgi:hypothetical protein
MFKYVKFTPFTDEYTTHEFIEWDEKCKVHRFDVPYVSVECATEADFTELMGKQTPSIEALEITQAEFVDMVQHSVQVKRMYDVANEKYVNECAAITAKYTQEEISTWGVQVDEAEAVKAGTATATPFLSALAADEGITLVQAADKILALRDANASYTANALTNKWNTLKALKAEVGL